MPSSDPPRSIAVGATRSNAGPSIRVCCRSAQSRRIPAIPSGWVSRRPSSIDFACSNPARAVLRRAPAVPNDCFCRDRKTHVPSLHRSRVDSIRCAPPPLEATPRRAALHDRRTLPKDPNAPRGNQSLPWLFSPLFFVPPSSFPSPLPLPLAFHNLSPAFAPHQNLLAEDNEKLCFFFFVYRKSPPTGTL